MTPDSKPGFYYVSCIDGDRYALVRGPWANDHASALAAVGVVRREAERADPRAIWYAFGTCRVDADRGPGVLGPAINPGDHQCDADCAGAIGPDDSCIVCGVWHGDPCGVCAGRGYHTATCPEVG